MLHLGDPVHGIAVAADDGSLTLVPLDQDLELGPEALTQAVTGMRVPAAERARFLGSTVPGLRQRVRVRSQVPLPAPEAGDDPATGESGRRRRQPRHRGLAAPAGHGPRRGRQRRARRGAARPRLRLRRHAPALHDAAIRRGARGPRPRRRARGAAGGHRARRGAAAPPAATATAPTRSRRAIVLRGLAAATFVPEVLPLLEADPHVTVEVDGDLPDYEEVTSAPVVRLGTTDSVHAEGALARGGPAGGCRAGRLVRPARDDRGRGGGRARSSRSSARWPAARR